MGELGELERHAAEFAQRNTRIVVVSVESSEAAKKTQADFPHLVVVADTERALSPVAGVIHRETAPDGSDTVAPTTILVDRDGTARWTFRPTRYLTRLSPNELLAAIDQYLPANR
jgi:peroxiredoxin